MTNSKRRVVITGMGVVCPLGNNLDEMWDALSTGRSGVDYLKRIPTEGLPVKIGGETKNFSGKIDAFGELPAPVKKTLRKGLKVMCHEIKIGVACAQHALNHAGLAVGDSIDPVRTGVVYGSDWIITEPFEFSGGVEKCTSERRFEMERWADDGMGEVTPLWLLKYLPNMPACHIAIYNDLRGPNNSLTVREASSNLAVAEAAATIARGNADVMIAGATGSRIHPLRTSHAVMQEQIAFGNGSISPEKYSRPFDKDRTGMVLGEGAGAIILEERESATKRGATIYGEIAGYGSSSVADRRSTGKIAKALQNVIDRGLTRARLAPKDVGHVHAHGLGAIKSDIREAEAITKCFRDNKSVPITAAKSYFGNLGAASGIVELISSLLAIRNDELFPILNLESPADDCNLPGLVREKTSPGDSVISVNVTPMGQASSLVVRDI